MYEEELNEVVFSLSPFFMEVMNLGGKGSGRPKGSYKPLSEVFSDLHCDVVDLKIKLIKKFEGVGDIYGKDFNSLQSKINYHIRKHKREERKLKRLKKRN